MPLPPLASPSPLTPTKSTLTSYIYPPVWSFPPFFTPQPNPSTHAHQLSLWTDLVLSFCRFHRIFILSPRDLQGDTLWPGHPPGRPFEGGERPPRQGVLECFWNRSCGGKGGRRVTEEFGRSIWAELVRLGQCLARRRHHHHHHDHRRHLPIKSKQRDKRPASMH